MGGVTITQPYLKFTSDDFNIKIGSSWHHCRELPACMRNCFFSEIGDIEEIVSVASVGVLLTTILTLQSYV